MVDPLSIIGLIASFSAALGFLPQVIKTFRTKSTKDISVYMIIVFIISAVSWSTYGFWKNDLFIILTNLTILILTLMLLFMKLKYRE
jgi:MtN3 and saliva related transmembrane protein